MTLKCSALLPRRSFASKVLFFASTLTLLPAFACTVGSSNVVDKESTDDSPAGFLPKENTEKGPRELDAALSAGEIPLAAGLDLRSFLAGHDLAWSLRDCEATLCLSTHAATWTGFDGEATPRYYLLAGLHLPKAAVQTPVVQHVIFVVALGSEQGTAEQRDIQDTLQTAIEALPTQDIVSLIAARADAEILVEATAPNTTELSTSIANYVGSSTSNTYDGLRRGYEIAHRQADALTAVIPRIVLITDAQITAGLTQPQRIENLVAAEGRSGIGLSVLGLGNGDSLALTFVHALAQAGGGHWRWLSDGPSLTFALQQEITQRWSRGPARAALTLRTTHEAAITSVFGARVNAIKANETTVEFTLPHGENGSERGVATAIFEIRPDSTGTTAIGELVLEYPELSSKLVSSTIPVAFADIHLPARGEPSFSDETSQRAFVALETFLAFERVALAAEVGELDLGLSELDTAQERLQSWLDSNHFAVPGEFAQDAIRAAQMRANLEDRLPH